MKIYLQKFFKIAFFTILFLICIISSKSYAAEKVKVADEISFDLLAKVDKIQYNTYHGGNFEKASIPEMRMFLDKDNLLNYVYYDDEYIYIQKMNKYNVTDGLCKITKRLPDFGSITYDKNGNYYIVTGKDKKGTTDAIIDVSKYGPGGKYISSFTKTADQNLFYNGTCSMAIDDNDILLVNYARQMTDGHQANKCLYLNINTMKESDYHKDPVYVSHSMFQDVIKLSSNNFLVLNQGDAGKRAFNLGYLYKDKSGYWVSTRTTPFNFREGANQQFGYNNTFATYGSLIELDTGVALIAASEKTLSMDPAKTKMDNEPNNLFIQIIKKDALRTGDITSSSFVTTGTPRVATGTEHISQTVDNLKYFVKEGTTDYGVKWLTNYTKDYTIWNTKAVKIDNNRIAILYEKDLYDNEATDDRNNLYYIIVDNKGNIVQDETLIEYGNLPGNEQPVYRNGYIYIANSNNTNNKRTYKIEVEKYIEKIDPIYPISITVDKNNFTGYVGDTVQLNLTYNPENSTEKNVTWDSENTKVATVSENGLVTLTGLGETNIFATLSNGNKAYCKIHSLTKNVQIEFKDDIYVAYTPNDTSSLNIKNEVKSVENIEIDNSQIKFTLSDKNAGTIDKNGIFNPNSSYKDKKITITADYFGNKATVPVRIAGKTSYTAYFNLKTDNDDEIKQNETKQVILYQDYEEYDVYKSHAEMDITYNSTNLSIDKLESLSEYVKAEKTAEGTIHVTYDTGKDFIQMNNLEMVKITFKAKVKAKTSNKIDITNITAKYKYNSTSSSSALKKELVTIKTTDGLYPIESISLNNADLNLTVGDTSILTVEYNPKNTTDSKIVTWTTGNSNVATVKNGIVTAIGAGTTTVTAKVGNKTASCTVRVKVPADMKYPLQSISINKSEITLDISKYEYLKVTYNPTNTTDDKTITWSSSNENIAKVATNGRVTGIRAGTAIIRAKVGNKYSTCKVTVNPLSYPLKSISLSQTNLTLSQASTQTLIVSYNPSNTTDNKTITWSSSDTKVAKVDSNGKITAVNEGVATITALAGNNITATCKVTVTKSSGFILGDVNNDKKISLEDAIEILKKITGKKKFTETEEKAADTNKDGKVSIEDAIQILKKITGKIKEF